jgi:uronate dehydrogenase
VDELSSDYELCQIDLQPIDAPSSIVADVSVPSTETAHLVWSAGFEKTDVLVHLAEPAGFQSSAEEVLPRSIRAAWNVMEAAVASGVRRIVYASSHWVVRGHELELEPDYIMANGRKIGSNARSRPVNYYGVSKICGEAIGTMLVEIGKLDSFVAVRIGNFDPALEPNDHSRVFGITENDLRSLFRCCVEADITGAHVTYGISRQERGPFDLSYTSELLDWEPKETPP